MNKVCAVSLIITALFLSPLYGSQGTSAQQVGIDEQLGRDIPLDLTFRDEKGNAVSLKDIVTKPTILSLIYYNCRHICPELLAGLSETLGAMDMVPGKDFSLLTVSFDDTDTPELALRTKKNYLSTLNKEMPEEAWKFLTGAAKNISALTDAAGFHFRKDKGGFLHPASLIVLSPKGKIIRYLYGSTFLPRDLSLAILEASEGRPGRSVGKLLLYCFSYDPEGKKYVFNILKVAGTVTILSLISFIMYLNLSNRSYRRKRMNNGGK